MGSQYVLSILVGVMLGVVSAYRPSSALDNTITVFSLASFAIPVFWLGQILILVFAYYLDWFPIQGMVNMREGYTGFAHVLDVAHHLVLPAFTLALYNLALILRLTRGSMLQVVGQEYIKVARAKGLSETTVMVKHALRNALLPVVTVIGLEFPNLIAGAVLTETVFGWPGLGRLVVESIFLRNYPLVQAAVLLYAVTYVMLNFLADILYTVLNPRVRL
jgi:peptide/nickel transport system permease protein